MPETLRQVRQFLRGLAGAREEVLAQCPSEQVKFESLGSSLLVTSGLAVISMWFALSTAMGINGIIAVFPALFWGLVIMGIDRWLITSMPLEGRRRLGIAAPRVLMALLLGSLISTPFVLRIFESEINAQISVIKEQRYDQFLADQKKSNVSAQVTNWTNQVASLQRVIDSGGAQPLDPAADPDVKALTAQRDKELQLEAGYFKTWQCQLYGVYQGVKCPMGNGPLAKASENSYNQAKARVAQLNSDISAREKQLAAADTASQQQRYDQAKSSLPYAQAQLQVARQRQDLLRTNFANQITALNGILVRLQALSQLSHDDFTVTTARWLLFLLFLVIECLPVTVKLLQQPGPYETILKGMQEGDLRSARRRGYRAPSPGEVPDQHHDGWTRPVIRAQSEQAAVVRGIWQQARELPRSTGSPGGHQAPENPQDGSYQGGHRNGSQNGNGRTPGQGSDGWSDDPYADRLRRADNHPASADFAQSTPTVNSPFRAGEPDQGDNAGCAGAPPGDDWPRTSDKTRRDGQAGRDDSPERTRADDNRGAERTRADRIWADSPQVDDTRVDAPHRPGQDAPIMRSGGMPRLDRHLRGMDDNRLSADSDGQTGVPLTWDEE